MRKSNALDALLPRTRQRVLAATLLHADRWWYLSDLAQHLGLGPSSLQREMARLVEAGILERRTDGNRVYYRADPACPFLPELQGLLIKTIGLTDVLRDALCPFGGAIVAAFIYGSVARGTEATTSDVDLMIIGDVRLADLAPALRATERQLLRAVNPVLFSPDEWARKVNNANHFVNTVRRAPKIFLIGNEHELDNASASKPDTAAHDQQA